MINRLDTEGEKKLIEAVVDSWEEALETLKARVKQKIKQGQQLRRELLQEIKEELQWPFTPIGAFWTGLADRSIKTLQKKAYAFQKDFFEILPEKYYAYIDVLPEPQISPLSRMIHRGTKNNVFGPSMRAM